jgi:16S rRNA (guanine966-N2)-methyltransferase
MRVITGTFRGRRLSAPAGNLTRPTSDRVREALFSMLGELDGLSVLDLFAGTGALGIEALSRGAAQALFVEHEEHALGALRENLGKLGLTPPCARVLEEDALRALRRAREREETYHLIFVDPPYAQAREKEHELQLLLPSLLAPDGRLVLESDRREPLSLDLEVLRQRHYGNTSITIHTQR